MSGKEKRGNWSQADLTSVFARQEPRRDNEIMAETSQSTGKKAEFALAEAIGVRGSDLSAKLGTMLGGCVLGCSVMEDKMIKPDLVIRMDRGEGEFCVLATVKSSLSEEGSVGHAGRLNLEEAQKLPGMPRCVLADCLDLISRQEYEYASKEARQRAKTSAADFPGKEMAQLGIVGLAHPAPQIMMVSAGQEANAVFFGPIESLLSLADEKGALWQEPREGNRYASMSWGGGLFSIREEQ